MKMAHAGQARAHYESMAYASRIEAAGPHELVAILYEELLLCLSVLGRAMRAGDAARMATQFGRATGIVHALQAGLDLEKGGQLAETLSGIYRSALLELGTARRTGEAGRIDRLAQAFLEMSDTWKKIAA